MERQLLQFFKKQNKELKEEVKEITQLLLLNKKALSIAVAYKRKERKHSNPIVDFTFEQKKQQNLQMEHKLTNKENNKVKTNEIQDDIPNLIRLLFKQNKILLDMNNKLRTQTQKNLCELLISNQIATASFDSQKTIVNELNRKVKELKKECDKKDAIILNLQKGNLSSKPFNSIIEFTELKVVSKKMNDNIQAWQQLCQQKNIEIDTLKYQKEELFMLNLVLTKQIKQLKMQGPCSTTAKSIEQQQVKNQKDISHMIHYQNKISNQNQFDFSDESSEHFDSQIESQIQQIEQKIEPTEIKAIPRLQLSKAKELQTRIVKKMLEKSKKQIHLPAKNQNTKTQVQFQNLHKRMCDELILRHSVQRQNAFLKRLIRQLQERNEKLIKSTMNVKLEQQMELKQQQRLDANTETLIDICRDVTLNQRLNNVCKGQVMLQANKKLLSKDI